jgi:hypothetical protein
MSERRPEPGSDPDAEPSSGAGAASPQGEQADDKEQAEGAEDRP